MPRVQLPDGSIAQFPDGMANDDIQKAIEDHLASQLPARPAGLPAGVELGQPAAHPAVNMRGGEGNLETIPSANSLPGVIGELQTGVHNFGARVANDGLAIARPIIHPHDTANDILNRSGFPLTPDAIKTASYNPSGPDVGATTTNLLGDAAFAGLMHGASSVGVPAVVSGVGRLGEGMQSRGADLINSKFAPTMKEAIRDNNPGRGILQSGIGTTLNKASLANKVANATEAVGTRIGDAVTRADNNALAAPILSKDLAPSIINPINAAVGKLEGPFGTASTAPYDAMRAKLGNTAPGATSPIYGPNAPAEIVPSDLWKHIQNLDQNTRFNTDPEVESVNETRRDIRQGLRPALEASDPTIKPLSGIYSDLLSANNAIDRAQGGFSVPKGLSSLVDSTIKSTPIVTGGGSGLFKLGSGLKSISTNAPEWLGGKGGSPATIGFQPKGISNTPLLEFSSSPSSIPEPGGEDFTLGGIHNKPSIVTPYPGERLRLPATSGGSEAQPMIGVKLGNHPGVATDFGRERITPTQFQSPQPVSGKGFTASANGEVTPNRLLLNGPVLPSAPAPSIPNTRLMQLLNTARTVLKP